MSARFLSALALIAAVTPAHAHPADRTEASFAIFETAMRCEVAAAYLRVSLAEEHARHEAAWMSAGYELGRAMLAGEISHPGPGKAHRCLRRFDLPDTPDLHAEEAAFHIGIALGTTRACLAEIFALEMLQDVPPVSDVLGDDAHRARSQAYARGAFEEMGCASAALPK